MIKHLLAYRHGNGKVEGFIGVGCTAESAKLRAEGAAMVKALGSGTPFDRKRLIPTEEEMTPGEWSIVRTDWNIANLAF